MGRSSEDLDGRSGGLDRLRNRLDHPRRVLLRDFVVFEVKLLLDQLKGLIISQAALIAFVIDFIRPRGYTFSLFYRVMALGERLDYWLSLYGPSRHAAEDPEGLFGESRAGTHNLLGQLEGIVHRIVVGREGEWTSAGDSSRQEPLRQTEPGPAGPGVRTPPSAP